MNRRTFLLIGTAMAGMMPAAGHAQADNSDPNAIIVTARRIEERLQDVPISITVFNQKQLANNNIVDAADLAKITPSLSVNDNFGSQNTSFAIRGFVQDNGTSPAVGVFFADVVAPRAGSNGLPAGDGAGPGSFFDLQNVQVLNGPQGTLFGRNTTGGDVLLVPQKPTGKFEGYLQGSYGNYDMYRVQGVINVPLSDTFRVRLGVDRMKRKGYLHNTSGIGPSDFDDTNYIAARLSIDADLTPNLENYIIASYSRANTHGDDGKLFAADPGFSLGGFGAAAQASQGNNFYDIGAAMANARSLLHTWQVIDTATWQASDTLKVKNIISYAQLYDYFSNPIFGGSLQSPPIGALNFPSYTFGFTSSTPLPNHETADASTFTEEFQLQGTARGGLLTWQTGAYFESVQPLDTVGSSSPTLLSCPTAAGTLGQCYDILGFLGALAGGTNPAGVINTTGGRTSFRNVGLYAQSTYKFSDMFKVTGGIRYTWDKEENTSVQTSTYVGFPPNLLGLTGPSSLPFTPFTTCTFVQAAIQDPSAPGGCTRNFVEKSSAPTWLIDFDYTPTHNLLGYAKYSRGYRAGGIAPNVAPPYDEFKAERVDAYEIGAKTSWNGAIPGTFDIAGFYNKFSNQQLQLGFNANPCQSTDAEDHCVASAAAPTAAPFNAGKSRIAGVEVDANVVPFTGLALHVGYTYLNTRITAINIPPLSAGSPYIIAAAYVVGDPVELTPKNKLVANATYTLPLDRSVGRLSVGATLTHTDKFSTNPSDRFYSGTAASDPATVAFIRTLSEIQATNLLNLSLTWDKIAGGPFDLAIFATNVTGQHYYTYIPGVASAIGFESGGVGAPRMYGASLKVRFGS